MQVVILVKENLIEVCKHLERKIKVTGKDVVVFCDPHEFYSALKSAGQGQVAYALIDVRTFQIDSFNPYKEVALMANPVPVVIFNDPYPDPDDRVSFWISQNKKYLSARIGDEPIDALYPSLCLLADFLDGKFNKYIPVIAKHTQLFSEEEKRLSVNIEDFEVKSKLSPSRLKLFEYFWRNSGKELSENAIVLFMFGECTRITKDRFYAYICDLRKALSRETAVKIEILRTFKEHYMMKVSLPAES